MVDRLPFDPQSSSYVYQDGDQLPPEFFDQADGSPWNEPPWTGQRPQAQAYGPSEDASEDGFVPQQDSGGTPRWPMQYHPAVDGDDHVAWDPVQHELATQFFPTYPTGTPFPSQIAHSDTSSPIAYYQPSSTVCHDYQQPWSIPYALPDHYSDTTPSALSTTTTNSDKTHRPTEHQSNHPRTPKDSRPSSSHHKVRKKRGEASEGPPSPENGRDPPSQTSSHKERNRAAANKFRSRKREDTDRLKVDEGELEKRNRELLNSAKQLKQEVYQLKMQLLKHSDCDCTLIQNYIKSEAHRYIHGIQPKIGPK